MQVRIMSWNHAEAAGGGPVLRRVVPVTCARMEHQRCFRPAAGDRLTGVAVLTKPGIEPGATGAVKLTAADAAFAQFKMMVIDVYRVMSMPTSHVSLGE